MMRDNIGKAIVREVRLEDLEHQSEELKATAVRFDVKSKKLRRLMFWKNIKVRYF